MRALTHPTGAVVGVLVCLVLSGCADSAVTRDDGDSDVAQVEQSPDSPEAGSESGNASPGDDLPSDEDVEAYFAAIASRDPGRLDDALAVTEPGSIAHAYAGYTLAVANASLDGGAPAPAGEFSDAAEGYQGCEQLNDEESCVTWSDFEGANGKLVNFTINGDTLNDRLSSGNGQSVSSGQLGSAKLLYAYKPVQSDALFVLAEVSSNDGAVNIGSYEARYRDDTGRQLTATEALGPTELGADSRSTVGWIFQGAETGGVATVTLYSSDFMAEEALQLKTR